MMRIVQCFGEDAHRVAWAGEKEMITVDQKGQIHRAFYAVCAGEPVSSSVA